MNDQEEQMGEVIVTMNKKQVQGITTIDLRLFENSRRQRWIENILKRCQA
jgi:hypothetical protein